MNTFAEIQNNTVTNIVISDDISNLSNTGTFVQVNTSTQIVHIGYTYDNNNQIFMPPQPDSSWVFNYTTKLWEPPNKPKDAHTEPYVWNESIKQWQKHELQDTPIILNSSLEVANNYTEDTIRYLNYLKKQNVNINGVNTNEQVIIPANINHLLNSLKNHPMVHGGTQFIIQKGSVMLMNINEPPSSNT